MKAILGGVLGKIPIPTPAMVVALLALFIAASGTAVAAISFTASDGTITACRDNRTGVLKVIQSGQTCTSKETTITWKDGITGKVADADKLDGKDSTEFAPNAVEAWRTVEFQNGWSDFAGQNVTTAAFYKDPWGVVHLKGVVSGGTVANSPVVASGTIFWLPCGYAPDQAETHAVLSNNQTGRVSVKWATTIGCSNGQKRGMVTADPPSNNAWVSLDGITFRAAGF